LGGSAHDTLHSYPESNMTRTAFCQICGIAQQGILKQCPNCHVPVPVPLEYASEAKLCPQCSVPNHPLATYCYWCGCLLPLTPYEQRQQFNTFMAPALKPSPGHLDIIDSGSIHPVIKILFLAANPRDTSRLRLDEEIRAIDHALQLAEFRSRFDIEQHWAIRVSDIQGCLLRHKPDIVHFSGHGSSSSDIILEDNSGNSCPLSPRALSHLFSVFRDNVRCVVLNACYSEQQAQAIANHIDCVIGMSNSIGDAAAVSFATSFYQAIGYGRDVKTAFELGCVQIDLERLGEQDTPRLLALRSNPNQLKFV
jgi:hypothetical protein